MEIRFTAILILSLTCASVSSGGTVTIDLASWDGSSDLPGGWIQEGLSHSATNGDYKGGAQFASVSGDRLRSPQMGYVITFVKAEIAYFVGEGKNPTRTLAMRPIVNGTNTANAVLFGEPRYIKDYEVQERNIALFGADEFVMKLEGSGNDGIWYVREITVTYDESRPVEHPVGPEPEPFHLGLTNCWKVSEFAKGESGCLERTADFSSIRFEGDKKTAAWTNGVSIDSFYAYSSAGACTQIRLAATNSSYCGIYSAATNDNHALALLGVEDFAMSMVLPVETLAAADSADWITSDVYTSGVSSVSRFYPFSAEIAEQVEIHVLPVECSEAKHQFHARNDQSSCGGTIRPGRFSPADQMKGRWNR